MTPPPATEHRDRALATRSGRLLDQALVALAAGNRRMILELVRDEPGPLSAMAGRFGVSDQAVSEDLSLFHSLEYERQLEKLADRYDPALVGAAGLTAGDAVLAIGCGSGPFARVAARIVTAGRVVGIDISAAMVRRAHERSRAEGLTNTTFAHGDAEVHPFEASSFDVAVSRLGAMYFRHPVAAFANIARALRPDGRLALLAWRDAGHNEWMTAVRDALAQGGTPPERPSGTPGAFGLADEAHVRRTLGEAGFVDVALEERSEPVNFGSDPAGAYALVSTQGLARDLLGGLDGATRKAALARLRDVLAAHETPDGVLFGSTCWLITARRP